MLGKEKIVISFGQKAPSSPVKLLSGGAKGSGHRDENSKVLFGVWDHPQLGVSNEDPGSM